MSNVLGLAVAELTAKVEAEISLKATIEEVSTRTGIPVRTLIMESAAHILRNFFREEFQRPENQKKLIFAIDYDGTFSVAPDLFSGLIEDIARAGHTVIMVTGRGDEGQWGEEVRKAMEKVPVPMPIIFAARGWKRAAAEAAGYKVDIWMDDHPEYIAPQDRTDVRTT